MPERRILAQPTSAKFTPGGFSFILQCLFPLRFPIVLLFHLQVILREGAQLPTACTLSPRSGRKRAPALRKQQRSHQRAATGGETGQISLTTGLPRGFLRAVLQSFKSNTLCLQMAGALQLLRRDSQPQGLGRQEQVNLFALEFTCL